MTRINSRDELNAFYATDDPWGYDGESDDLVRRHVLVQELRRQPLGRVLDIGCGNGFITAAIPADDVTGVDISDKAIDAARRNHGGPDGPTFLRASLFELPGRFEQGFDTVLITGLLYPQYIGNGQAVVYRTVDQLLNPGGLLVSVHIDSWYDARFPYFRLRQLRYDYREYVHLLEVYRK